MLSNAFLPSPFVQKTIASASTSRTPILSVGLVTDTMTGSETTYTVSPFGVM